MPLTTEEALVLLTVASKLRHRNKWIALILECVVVERPLIPNVAFNITSYKDEKARIELRFTIPQIRYLCVALRPPETVLTPTGDLVTSLEALCVVSARMAYPKRNIDLSNTFGRSRSSLWRIYLTLVNQLFGEWESHSFLQQRLLTQRAQAYVAATMAKGSVIPCVGFIDGTKIPTCRISPRGEGIDWQKGFQSITTSNGLNIHFWGPVEGRRHDVTILRLSKVSMRLRYSLHYVESSCTAIRRTRYRGTLWLHLKAGSKHQVSKNLTLG
ncbi:TPA: hypothetical protein N0F65_003970 [Lagenidium giganteum]|uniref:DDE Tnp4 domain-containing protein n=1 Tax=Lagenidium giganteum TaxID=4803 RepID=A0AAV2YSI7_9STRA|nr:TPA: hypothetical protein N0F65_003970 [Lagenidium giganteum]